MNPSSLSVKFNSSPLVSRKSKKAPLVPIELCEEPPVPSKSEVQSTKENLNRVGFLRNLRENPHNEEKYPAKSRQTPLELVRSSHLSKKSQENPFTSVSDQAALVALFANLANTTTAGSTPSQGFIFRAVMMDAFSHLLPEDSQYDPFRASLVASLEFQKKYHSIWRDSNETEVVPVIDKHFRESPLETFLELSGFGCKEHNVDIVVTRPTASEMSFKVTVCNRGLTVQKTPVFQTVSCASVEAVVALLKALYGKIAEVDMGPFYDVLKENGPIDSSGPFVQGQKSGNCVETNLSAGLKFAAWNADAQSSRAAKPAKGLGVIETAFKKVKEASFTSIIDHLNEPEKGRCTSELETFMDQRKARKDFNIEIVALANELDDAAFFDGIRSLLTALPKRGSAIDISRGGRMIRSALETRFVAIQAKRDGVGGQKEREELEENLRATNGTYSTDKNKLTVEFDVLKLELDVLKSKLNVLKLECEAINKEVKKLVSSNDEDNADSAEELSNKDTENAAKFAEHDILVEKHNEKVANIEKLNDLRRTLTSTCNVAISQITKELNANIEAHNTAVIAHNESVKRINHYQTLALMAANCVVESPQSPIELNIPKSELFDSVTKDNSDQKVADLEDFYQKYSGTTSEQRVAKNKEVRAWLDSLLITFKGGIPKMLYPVYTRICDAFELSMSIEGKSESSPITPQNPLS